jgi:hypothetical protein
VSRPLSTHRVGAIPALGRRRGAIRSRREEHLLRRARNRQAFFQGNFAVFVLAKQRASIALADWRVMRIGRAAVVLVQNTRKSEYELITAGVVDGQPEAANHLNVFRFDDDPRQQGTVTAESARQAERRSA